MVDITKLNVGDIFYRLMWYEAVYKMELIKEYDIEKNIVLAKYIEGNTHRIGKEEWVEPDEDEKYFLTYDEAEKAYLQAQEERLEYLSDINNLLDELYSELDGDESNSVRLYGEAIKRFKKRCN